MCTVTQRISQVSQPRGGYIKPSQFTVIEKNDGQILNEEENLHPSVVGMAIDYLTRYLTGAKIDKAFEISIVGATLCEKLTKKDSLAEIATYLANIKGNDKTSIVNACKAVTFDVWYRNLFAAFGSRNATETNPDEATIQNIQIMLNRSLSFFKEYGPVVVDGFTFEKNGYTKTVDSGDGDFLTKDTLWDFKVSKSKPTNKHTLQLLMYWIMGIHSGKKEFKPINKLGIFNPRLNDVFLLGTNSISEDIIRAVEKDVICY